MTDAAPEHDVVDDPQDQAGEGSGGTGDELDGSVEVAGESTGVPAVDAAIARLDGLEERPVEEHPEVFEAVHDALRGALGNDGA